MILIKSEKIIYVKKFGGFFEIKYHYINRAQIVIINIIIYFTFVCMCVTVSYMLQFFLLISSNRKLLSERRLNKSILEVDERDE